MRSIFAGTALGFVFWAGGWAPAQTTRPATRPAGAVAVDESVFLIRDPKIQAELGCNPNQRAAIEKMLAEVDGPLWALRNAPDDVVAEKLPLLVAQVRGRIKNILPQPQLLRLSQLALQYQGLRSVLQPDLAGKLALTDEQSERIRAIVDKTNQAQRAIQELARSGEPRTRIQQLFRLCAEQERDDILAVLTDAQKRQWSTRTGKPFDLAGVQPLLFRAPELEGTDTWINSKPLTLEALRGQVVAVHFYAFGCSNCVANYPLYKEWQKTYAPRGLALIGIHTPETPGERDVEQVRAKARENGLTFPILVDNERKNWQAWSNNVWPAVYLIDKQGRIRYWWYGELKWKGAQGDKIMATRIEELLAEAAPAAARPAPGPTADGARK